MQSNNKQLLDEWFRTKSKVQSNKKQLLDEWFRTLNGSGARLNNNFARPVAVEPALTMSSDFQWKVRKSNAGAVFSNAVEYKEACSINHSAR